MDLIRLRLREEAEVKLPALPLFAKFGCTQSSGKSNRSDVLAIPLLLRAVVVRLSVFLLVRRARVVSVAAAYLGGRANVRHLVALLFLCRAVVGLFVVLLFLCRTVIRLLRAYLSLLGAI